MSISFTLRYAGTKETLHDSGLLTGMGCSESNDTGCELEHVANTGGNKTVITFNGEDLNTPGPLLEAFADNLRSIPEVGVLLSHKGSYDSLLKITKNIPNTKVYSNFCYFNSQLQSSGIMEGIDANQVKVKEPQNKSPNGNLICETKKIDVKNPNSGQPVSMELNELKLVLPDDVEILKRLAKNLADKSISNIKTGAGYEINLWDPNYKPGDNTTNDRFTIESGSYQKFLEKLESRIRQIDKDYKLPELPKSAAPSEPSRQPPASLDLSSSDTWIAIGKSLIAQFPGILLTSAITYMIFKRLHATAQISAEVTTRKADAKRDWLGEFGENLNDKIKNYVDDPAVGREPIIRDMTKTLTRNVGLDVSQGKGDPNAPALLGEAGVGKTSVVEGLAWRIANNDPSVAALHGYTIISIDLKKIAKGLGKGTIEELPRILDGLIEQARSRHGKVILYIDEVHRLMEIGKHSQGKQSIAEYFKEVMGRGEIEIIVSTTRAEFKEYVEPNIAFTRRLKEIDIPEPHAAALKIILERKAKELAAKNGLNIDPDLLKRIPEMAKRYFPRAGANPAASLAMLGELFESQALANEQQPSVKNIIDQASLDHFAADKRGRKIAENISQLQGEISLLNESLTEMGYPELVIVPENISHGDNARIRDLRALKGALESQIGIIRSTEQRGIVFQPRATNSDFAKWSDILNEHIDPVALHQAFEAVSPELGEHFYHVYAKGDPIQTVHDLLQRMSADVLNRAYENIIASGQTLQQMGTNKCLYMTMTESATRRGIITDRDMAKVDLFDQTLKAPVNTAKSLNHESQKRVEEHRDLLKRLREGKK